MNFKDMPVSNAIGFMTQCLREDKTVDMLVLSDTMVRIFWVENKSYLALDGTTQVDEVWTKDDGSMISVQDLTLEESHHIIRKAIMAERQSVIDEGEIEGPRVLH